MDALWKAMDAAPFARYLLFFGLVLLIAHLLGKRSDRRRMRMQGRVVAAPRWSRR